MLTTIKLRSAIDQVPESTKFNAIQKVLIVTDTRTHVNRNLWYSMTQLNQQAIEKKYIKDMTNHCETRIKHKRFKMM